MTQRTIVEILKGKCIEGPPPMWMMRQAGRYLPEYRKLRKDFPDFMSFCQNVEAVVEATLQPLRRWPFDASIIFSDILLIPHLLGQTVTFTKGIGPELIKPNWETFLEAEWTPNMVKPTLTAIKELRNKIPNTCTLFGFAGAPWTLLRYMYTGNRSDPCEGLLQWGETDLGKHVIHKLEQCIVKLLTWQLEAGCDVIQLFDSWAADVPQEKQSYWLWRSAQNIINQLPPHSVIYFGKGVELQASQNLKNCGLSLSSSINPLDIHTTHPLQGNLDPLKLVSSNFHDDVSTLIQNMQGKPFIFNLGHGILPQTPIQHVDELVELVTCTSHSMKA